MIYFRGYNINILIDLASYINIVLPPFLLFNKYLLPY